MRLWKSDGMRLDYDLLLVEYKEKLWLMEWEQYYFFGYIMLARLNGNKKCEQAWLNMKKMCIIVKKCG